MYGFTRNPITLDYMIVMNYAENGNLRKGLQIIIKDKWMVKLKKLYNIIKGLDHIHQQKLVHCDFHHGNILLEQENLTISDLGLCFLLLTIRSQKLYIQLNFLTHKYLITVQKYEGYPKKNFKSLYLDNH